MKTYLAAVDLGSNSFRASVGLVQTRNALLQVVAVERLKETVRLAAGLNATGMLDESAIQRGEAVLTAFRQAFSRYPLAAKKAVATNTLRLARNANVVKTRFESALDMPIQIISGEEEARLIYQGISSQLPLSNQRRLMIDIGGSSTEIIVGQGQEILALASLPLGCLTFTTQFFPAGSPITSQAMQLAINTAYETIYPVAHRFQALGWDCCYGSSGTAKGLVAVLEGGGYTTAGITRAGMEQLKQRLLRDGSVQLEQLPGLKKDRALVLAGGLSIMLAAFEALAIHGPMVAGEGALRAGLLAQLQQAHYASAASNV